MLFRFFERLVDPLPDEAPGPPPTRLWPFVWHYARPFRWLFATLLATTVVVGAIEVYAFAAIGELIDLMRGTSPGAFLAEHRGRLIVLGLVIGLVWPLVTLFDDLCLLQGVMGNMPMSIRWRGHRHLLRQSTAFYANEFAGRLSTKLMQAALGVRDTVVKLTNVVVYMSVYMVGALALFAGADIRLAVPLLLWVVGYALLMRTFIPKLRAVSEVQSDARSTLTGRIVDAYTNIQTVKLFSSASAEDDYAREGMEAMLVPVYRQMRLATALSFCLHTLNAVLVASTIGLGVVLWSGSLVTAGAVAAAGGMVMRLQGLSHYFLWEVANLFENVGMAEDAMKTLSRPVAVRDAAGAQRLRVTEGAVRFEGVSFAYQGGQANHPVIDALDLDVAPGERVGLVGRSGAGKSTLVGLLLRLHEPQGGRVLIDGQDTSAVTQDSLRAAIAVVSQDTSLLHRSIRDNIAYGRPGASEADVLEAARRAEALPFIEGLADEQGRHGLDAMVGERGVKLSGGQRQRIALARLILKDAPILVLDEATSALDSEVEAAIQARMGELFEGRTVVAIAHRLSTIAAMDRLVVMDEGRIAEMGTHDELLARGGLYARLWSHQSGGFVTPQRGVREWEAEPV